MINNVEIDTASDKIITEIQSLRNSIDESFKCIDKRLHIIYLTLSALIIMTICSAAFITLFFSLPSFILDKPH
jgi:hypothetical protein